MDRSLARDAALTLMEDYGLTGWVFAFDRAKRRAGSCNHGRRVITLSQYFVDLNSFDEVDDTIRHEIAHALVSVDHGHDAMWRAMARRVGAKPERCYDSAQVVMPQGTWRADCPCGDDHARHRRPKPGTRYGCRVSGAELTWTYRKDS